MRLEIFDPIKKPVQVSGLGSGPISHPTIPRINALFAVFVQKD